MWAAELFIDEAESHPCMVQHMTKEAFTNNNTFQKTIQFWLMRDCLHCMFIQLLCMYRKLLLSEFATLQVVSLAVSPADPLFSA